MDLIYITKHLNTQRKCVKYLEQKRWNGVPTCPYCRSQRSGAKGLRHNCLDCTNSYSVTVGTVFESSNLPLMKWFMAISLILSAKKGVSSMQLSRDISVNKNTAWLLQMKIRNVMGKGDLEQLGGKVKRHGKSKNKNQGGPHHLQPVLGMVERKGNVILKTIKAPLREYVMPLLKKHVNAESIIVTDGSQAYFPVKKHFEGHKIMSHSTGIYKRGIYHTNTIEGVWSQLKRAIIGQYHRISDEYLQFYLDEISFKYNHRDRTDLGYNRLLSQMLGNCIYTY